MALGPVTELAHLEVLRSAIERQYLDCPTGCGASFGEILCHEIHTNNRTFRQLAHKWGIGLASLGELISDHCKRLEKLPQANHDYPLPRRLS